MTRASSRPEIGDLAAAAAQRLAVENAAYRRVPVEALAEQLRALLEDLLTAAGGRGSQAQTRVARRAAAWSGLDLDVCDLLAVYAELLRVLQALRPSGDGTRQSAPDALEKAATAWLEGAAERLERARDERLAATVQALPQTVLAIDGEGAICDAHSYLCAQLGLAPATLIGRPLAGALTPDLEPLFSDPESVPHSLAAIVAAPAEAHEYVFALRDGDALLLRSLPLAEHADGASIVIASIRELKALAELAAPPPARARAAQAERELARSLAETLTALRLLDPLGPGRDRDEDGQGATSPATSGAQADPQHPHPHLSQRESEVLLLLANGLTGGEIGKRLFISPQTVRVHARRLMQKLGAKTRAEAVAIGFRQTLLL